MVPAHPKVDRSEAVEPWGTRSARGPLPKFLRSLNKDGPPFRRITGVGLPSYIKKNPACIGKPACC